MTERRESERMLAALLGPLAERLREVSLPLHILLENRFGELNDNQLEMIEAARQGADEADQLLRLVRRVRSLEDVRGPESPADVRPLDLLRAPVALAAASGEARGITVDLDASPALPYVRGERAHLEEAMSLLLSLAVRTAGPGAAIAVSAQGEGDAVVVRVRPWPPTAESSLDLLLAARLLKVEKGALEAGNGEVLVRLPSRPGPTAA